jgi:hypothetical protein
MINVLFFVKRNIFLYNIIYTTTLKLFNGLIIN